MAGHRRRTSAPNTGPCQLRTSNWLVKSQDSRAQSTNRPACHPAAGRSEPPERHNKVGHPSVLARCFHKRCTRTNLSVTLASCEQGIEEYLQGTSPALLAAYEKVVRDLVTLLPSGLQMLELGADQDAMLLFFEAKAAGRRTAKHPPLGPSCW